MRTGSPAAAAMIGFMLLSVQSVGAQVAPAVCVGAGDVVQVTVFETVGATGRPGNSVTLSSQVIGPSGVFSVPFAGDIVAAGRPLPEIAREIEDKLATRAIEPRVEVALIRQGSTGSCLPR